MMRNTPVYLRSDVMIEPLVDHWYAWSYLIPPITAARNIEHRHIPIMESYIRSPKLHADAVANPKLLGGPFIDYGGKRVVEISDLKDATTERCAQLIELSKAIHTLDEMLRNCAKGGSLGGLYQKIPDILRGFVELSYDLNNNPGFRVLEALVYRSSLYQTELQSVMLSITQSDDRPFTLSTPRLKSSGSIELGIPFKDQKLDKLAQLKYMPSEEHEILAEFEINAEDVDLFKSFLTVDPPRRYEKYEGSGARWRYFGHACILLETSASTILFDPVISYRYDTDLDRYTYSDLPPWIDHVIITHNHQDHILFETLLQLRHKIGSVIVPRGSGKLQDPSLKLLLQAAGFKNVIELDELDEHVSGDIVVQGIPFFGEHADLDIRSKLAYLLKINGHRLLFAADSCNIEPVLYERVRSIIGDIDILFLGMECDGAPLTWLYGPLLTQRLDRSKDASRRLSGSNFQQAEHIVNCFKCEEVYVYAMGQEPWLNYVMSIKYTDDSNPIIQSNLLLAKCREKGIQCERLYGEKEILLD